MKPKLKPPGTKRLKLNCDILYSNSAFKFNLRRYSPGSSASGGGGSSGGGGGRSGGGGGDGGGGRGNSGEALA